MVEEPANNEMEKPTEMYVIGFFPKKEGIVAAQIGFYRQETLSHTRQEAIAKFLVGTATKAEKWEDYVETGHRVRKVRIVDLGDAPVCATNGRSDVSPPGVDW